MMHISDKDWENFYKNQTDEKKILSHVEGCEYCAGRMIEFFPKEEIIEPMPHLREKIIRESAKYSRQSMLAEKFEFMFYCARVGIAMCFALIILFTSDFAKISELGRHDFYMEEVHEEKGESITNIIWNAAGGISGMLNDFYKDLGNIKFKNESEDIKYENAEK